MSGCVLAAACAWQTCVSTSEALNIFVEPAVPMHTQRDDADLEAADALDNLSMKVVLTYE